MKRFLQKAWRAQVKSWSTFFEFLWWCTPVIVVGLAVVAAGVWLLGGKKTHLNAPIEFCTQANSGRTKEEVVPQQMCAGYDKNGACTAPFVIYNTVTYREVVFNCNWSEWK